MISASFEDLSQSLRVLQEANWRAHSEHLLFVDRAEAVGNIDAGVNAVLNSFHSLCDAVAKDPGVKRIKYYERPELATVLAIRNARHHNWAFKIRHLYNYHVQTTKSPEEMRRYVVVDFRSNVEDATTIDVHLSWSDLEHYLSLPTSESRLKPATRSAIRSYLNADKFSEYAEERQLPVDRVFFNVVPLFVNAGSQVVPVIADRITATSTEANIFVHLFDGTSTANASGHKVDTITVFLPN